MPKLKARAVRESEVEMVEVVLPNDANPLGTMLGGRVMHLIDIAGAIAAHRHARRVVVTVSMDHLDFVHPIRVGQLIVLRGRVTRAFKTSVEVAVQVYREDFITGERLQTSSAFVTFVALDEKGQPTAVPPVLARTAEEKQNYRDALARRRQRLQAAARAQCRYFKNTKRKT